MFYRIPSVRTLCRLTDRPTARRVRRALEGRLPLDETPHTDKWVRSCYHAPRFEDVAMAQANELLDLHGVETLFIDDGILPICQYLNAGDTYTATLLHNELSRCVWVTSWGDFVEAQERRGRRIH